MLSSWGKYRRSFKRHQKEFLAPLAGRIYNIYQVPNYKSHLLAIYIICHLLLVFLSPNSQKFAVLFAPLFLFAVFLPDLFFCATLFAVINIMNGPSSIACTSENEVHNIKQRGGENFKDPWYRICNDHNRSIRKQSTIVLLRCFYVGITTWYRFILDTITDGK